MLRGCWVRLCVTATVVAAVMGRAPAVWGQEGRGLEAGREGKVEGREKLVLTVAPPLDERRLADALGAYLEGFDIQIERSAVAGAGAGDDLRGVLGELERTGQGARALATVRVTPGATGQAEIVLVDLLTGKALVTSVPRPRRDEDLIRTVALKVQALLRSTLAEAPERLEDHPSLLRLTGAGSSAPPLGSLPPARLFMETAYVATAAGAGQVQHGVAATAGWRAGERWELRLGIAALTALSAEADRVAVTLNRIPFRLAAQLRWPGRTVEVLAGPEVMVAVAGVAASSSAQPVRSGRSMAVGAGLGVEGRARLGRAAWLYLRGAALGLLMADRYTVNGQPVLALNPVQVDVELGLGADVW